MTSWRIVSFLTQTHTSSKSCEAISHTSLCLNLKKPPFLQDRACVTSNDVPYIELKFYQVACYIWSLILMASQNSCFANSYPSSLMSKFVNQYETPVWLRASITLFLFFQLMLQGLSQFFLISFFTFSFDFISSPALVLVGSKNLGLKVWSYSCPIFVLVFCCFYEYLQA